MSHRGSQLNKTHPVATDAGLCNFYTTALADNPSMAHPFVLTTMAFPILSWSKDALAKQTIHFWFEGAVINSFWLGNFTYKLSIG